MSRIASGYVQSQKQLSSLVSQMVEDWSEGDEEPVKVEFVASGRPSVAPPKDALNYSLETVFAKYNAGGRTTSRKAAEFASDQAMMRAIAQVLYAAGVFDNISHEKQEQLLSDLAAIVFLRRGL